MGYKISWMVQDRVLLATLDRVISLEDLESYRDTRADMVKASNNGNVHTIVDSSQTDSKASHLPLSGMAKIFSNTTDTTGWGVIINSPSAQQWVTSILLQLVSGKYRMFISPQDALNFLMEHDPSVGQLTVEQLTHALQN
jgi:hypothetical protein